MGVGKRHHYIPQFIIRRFADANGDLFVVDRERPELDIRRTKSEQVFAENHLYSIKNDGVAGDRSLEADLGGIESQAAPVVEKIVLRARQKLPAGLTLAEREIWDTFFAVQFRRVPELHRSVMTDEAFAQSIEEIIQEYEDDYRPLTAEEKALVEVMKTDKEVRHNTAVQSIRIDSGAVTSALAERGLVTAVPSNPKKSFVLGSRPIVRAGPSGETLYHAEIEAWLVLAPDVAVSYYGRYGDDQLRFLDGAQMRRLNQWIFRQSRFVASNSSALLMSLLTAR